MSEKQGLRVIFSWLTLIAIAASCVALVVDIVAAPQRPDPEAVRREACAAVGGHFDRATSGSASVCWADDGARRLFPWDEVH